MATKRKRSLHSRDADNVIFAFRCAYGEGAHVHEVIETHVASLDLVFDVLHQPSRGEINF